jgi:hypothetical protein
LILRKQTEANQKPRHALAGYYLKNAKTLGLTLPQSLRAIANMAIE